jgi:hypothetical protein
MISAFILASHFGRKIGTLMVRIRAAVGEAADYDVEAVVLVGTYRR